ncbi:unnamed protein product, partial [Ectocarpus sp. 8 AP-2014]
MPGPTIFRSDLLRSPAPYIDRLRTLERSTPGVSYTANCPVGLGLVRVHGWPGGDSGSGTCCGFDPCRWETWQAWCPRAFLLERRRQPHARH